MTDSISVPVGLLKSLVDQDDCSWDHNHSCQTHGYLYLAQGEKCPMYELRELLGEFKEDEPPLTQEEAAKKWPEQHCGCMCHTVAGIYHLTACCSFPPKRRSVPELEDLHGPPVNFKSQTTDLSAANDVKPSKKTATLPGSGGQPGGGKDESPCYWTTDCHYDYFCKAHAGKQGDYPCKKDR